MPFMLWLLLRENDEHAQIGWREILVALLMTVGCFGFVILVINFWLG